MNKKKRNGDALKPMGRVSIKVYNSEGALLDIIKGNNLVVNGGREACAILTATGDTDKLVQDIAFGSGTTAPDLTDTALVSQTLIKALEPTTSYPTQTSVKYIGICETTENNGNQIREVGLFCADSTLFARFFVGRIVKTSDIRVVVEWTITF